MFQTQILIMTVGNPNSFLKIGNILPQFGLSGIVDIFLLYLGLLRINNRKTKIAKFEAFSFRKNLSNMALFLLKFTFQVFVQSAVKKDVLTLGR